MGRSQQPRPSGNFLRVPGCSPLWLLLLLALGLPVTALAQEKQPQPATQKAQPEVDAFPPNPLELTAPDPLLPDSKRPLTGAERQQLGLALDQLNAQAAAEFKAGRKLPAFDIWNRELRLRRFLGPVVEIEALGRVGDIAWNETQTTQVRWITKRLDEMFAQAQATTPNLNLDKAPTGVPPIDASNRPAVLEALGVAYQQVRLPETAIVIYQQILAEARQRKDAKKIEATLLTLGQLNLDWFDYVRAADAYRELLAIAQAKKDTQNQVVYLNQLAFVSEQAKQPQAAIEYQQQLVTLYQALNTPQPIPALKIRIGDNYQLLSRPDLAEQNYQTAYQLAQPLVQLAYAADALQKLGALYRSNDRLDAAIRVYDFLIGVEQQAYNLYGVMNAYDQLGQIYLSRQAYPQALTAFQRGLGVARQLKYREDYFLAQLQQIPPASR